MESLKCLNNILSQVGVRAEFNTIVKEVEDLQKAQEEMFATIMQQLHSAQAAADTLKDISGFNSQKWSEKMILFVDIFLCFFIRDVNG